MVKFSFPKKLIIIVQLFDNGMLVMVIKYGDFLKAFVVTNSVKQGYALAPTLFSMMFSAMLTNALGDYKNGIKIKYHFDGELFNVM